MTCKTCKDARRACVILNREKLLEHLAITCLDCMMIYGIEDKVK